MSGRDDCKSTTDEDIIGNATESKSHAMTSPSNHLHPILIEDCTKLGNVVKSDEILDPKCKTEVDNNSVFNTSCNITSTPRTFFQTHRAQPLIVSH